MSDAWPATKMNLLRRTERLAKMLELDRKPGGVPATIMDDFVRLVAASVRQYQRERAVDRN